MGFPEFLPPSITQAEWRVHRDILPENWARRNMFDPFIFTEERLLKAEAALRLSGECVLPIVGTHFELLLMGLMPLMDEEAHRHRSSFLHYTLNASSSTHLPTCLVNALPRVLAVDSRWSTTALLLVALQDDVGCVQELLRTSFPAFSQHVRWEGTDGR